MSVVRCVLECIRAHEIIHESLSCNACIFFPVISLTVFFLSEYLRLRPLLYCALECNPRACEMHRTTCSFSPNKIVDTIFSHHNVIAPFLFLFICLFFSVLGELWKLEQSLLPGLIVHVHNISIIKKHFNLSTGISMHKGYAFVQFTNPFDARNACHGEDGRNILSQVLGKFYWIIYDFGGEVLGNHLADWTSLFGRDGAMIGTTGCVVCGCGCGDVCWQISGSD